MSSHDNPELRGNGVKRSWSERESDTSSITESDIFIPPKPPRIPPSVKSARLASPSPGGLILSDQEDSPIQAIASKKVDFKNFVRPEHDLEPFAQLCSLCQKIFDNWESLTEKRFDALPHYPDLASFRNCKTPLSC